MKEEKVINKNEILDSFFNVIKESGDWSYSCTDAKEYSSFVDGVVEMTNEILARIELKNQISDLGDDSK